jgi:hypothetical protein
MVLLHTKQLIGRDGFAHQLQTEFTNFRKSRSCLILLCAVVVFFVLVSFASTLASHAGNSVVPPVFGGEPVTDTYTFVHQPLAGDGTLTARVASLSGTYLSTDTSASASGSSPNGQPGSQLQPGLAPWAKAGILLEPYTNQGTDYAALMVTGSHGVRMQYDYTHDSPGLPGPVEPSSPRWLRLTRVGDIVTGYDSTDSLHWTEVGTVRLTDLAHTVQVGFFVTSPLYFVAGANAGVPSVATAAFDHLAIEGDLPQPTWIGDTIGGFYPSLQPDSIWEQQSDDAFTISGSGDIAPLVGAIIFSIWSGASIVNGTIVGLLLVIVLAAVFATSAYRRRHVSAVPAAGPRRVLAARAIVAGSLAFAAGTVATAIAEVVIRHVLAANGIYLFPQSGPVEARVILGTGLFLGLAAALVVALGMILRSGTLTVFAGIALLMVPGVIVTLLPADSESWLMRFTPTAAFAIQAALPRSNLVTDAYTILNGYFPVSPWVGLAVLAAYTLATLGAAVWLLRNHQAT